MHVPYLLCMKGKWKEFDHQELTENGELRDLNTHE